MKRLVDFFKGLFSQGHGKSTAVDTNLTVALKGLPPKARINVLIRGLERLLQYLQSKYPNTVDTKEMSAAVDKARFLVGLSDTPQPPAKVRNIKPQDGCLDAESYNPFVRCRLALEMECTSLRAPRVALASTDPIASIPNIVEGFVLRTQDANLSDAIRSLQVSYTSVSTGPIVFAATFSRVATARS